MFCFKLDFLFTVVDFLAAFTLVFLAAGLFLAVIFLAVVFLAGDFFVADFFLAVTYFFAIFTHLSLRLLRKEEDTLLKSSIYMM